VVLALANELINHPDRTLNSVEIDQCIADTLDREARKGEVKRRVSIGSRLWKMQLTSRLA
jgi:hypothetical protein